MVIHNELLAHEFDPDTGNFVRSHVVAEDEAIPETWTREPITQTRYLPRMQDGAWVEAEPEKALQSARKAAYSRIKDRQYTLSQSGMEFTGAWLDRDGWTPDDPPDDLILPTDEEARAGLTSFVQTARETDRFDPEVALDEAGQIAMIIDVDERPVIITLATLQPLANAVRQHMRKIHKAATKLRREVARAEDPAAVDLNAYWPKTLPEFD